MHKQRVHKTVCEMDEQGCVLCGCGSTWGVTRWIPVDDIHPLPPLGGGGSCDGGGEAIDGRFMRGGLP